MKAPTPSTPPPSLDKMPRINRAALNARGLTNQFRSFLLVAEHLEVIGDLQQAYDDNTAATLQARQDCAEARQALSNIQTKCRDAEEALRMAKEDAVAMATNARSAADRVVAEAHAGARKLIADAKQRHLTITEEGNRVKEATDARVSELKDTEAAAELRVNALRDELASLKERLG